MLMLTYLLRNLGRNPLRTLLTCAAVGLPIMIFVLSVATVDGIERFLDNSAKQLRLAVTSKSSIVNPLPEGHRAKMESLDPTHTRLIAVCGMHWIGGKVENDKRPLSTLGADVDTFPITFPEYKLTPQQLDTWNKDRRSIIIGESTAAQFGWKEGDRITIRGSTPPYQPIEFIVAAVGVHAADKITNFFRRDYFEELISNTDWFKGWISFYFVKCASQKDLEEFRHKIDELFARTPDETATQDEKTFMNSFISQQFDLPANLTVLSAVTVFVAIMAAANTMSMNFRDRISELATLKSLGFRGGVIRTLVLSESLLLCGIGGAAGAALPVFLFSYTPLKDVTIPLIQYLIVRPEVCMHGVLISLGIGLLAALWPSWLAMRLHVVQALRNID